MKKPDLSLLLLCFGFLSNHVQAGKRTALLLVLAFVFIPNLTFGGGYKLGTPAAIQYFDTMKRYSIPGISTGVVSGGITNDSVGSNAGFNDEYYKTFDYLVTSDTVGAEVGINLSSSGAVTYNYQIPFSVTYDFPDQVYPGQRIYLEPTFAWDTPTLTSTQQYNYYTSYNIGVNPPSVTWV
jgi:hypothetical protein